MMAVRDHGLFRKLVTPAADTAHSGCYICNNVAGGVDTGVYIDYEGSLFLCTNCIKELAEVAGMSVDVEGEMHERELEYLHHENTSLTAELADARDQLDAFGIAVARAQAKGKH